MMYLRLFLKSKILQISSVQKGIVCQLSFAKASIVGAILSQDGDCFSLHEWWYSLC